MSQTTIRPNHDQTMLTAACSDCAFVWRGSNELSPDQTTLSAACSVQHKQRVPCESLVWFDSFEPLQTTVNKALAVVRMSAVAVGMSR